MPGCAGVGTERAGDANHAAEPANDSTVIATTKAFALPPTRAVEAHGLALIPPTISTTAEVFNDTCIPGTWSLSAAAFSEYLQTPSTGSAILRVEPNGAYWITGRFGVRQSVGNNSVFVFDAIIDQRGRFTSTGRQFGVRKEPVEQEGVQISGERSEGTGGAPDGVLALEPDFSKFLSTNVITCNGTSLYIPLFSPWPQRGEIGPARLNFQKQPAS